MAYPLAYRRKTNQAGRNRTCGLPDPSRARSHLRYSLLSTPTDNAPP